MRYAYIGAPLLVVAYGVVRLIDGLDGSKGPGPAWTIGHLFFLAALALFAVAMVGLWRERRNWITTAALVGGVTGAVAMARVVVVDIIVAWGAADRAEMERNYARYEFPLGDLGGILFPLGLLVLLIAVRRPWWRPVAALAGFAAILVSLDLLPLAGVLLLTGTFRSPVPVPRRP
jgi:hypothetical protein